MELTLAHFHRLVQVLGQLLVIVTVVLGIAAAQGIPSRGKEDRRA